MRPLALTPEVSAACAKLRAYAEAHPLSWSDVQSIASGALPPIGDNPHHQLEIPFGFRVAFSLEFQKWIRCRHLSVSVDGKKGACPHEAAVHEIAKLLGVTDGIKGQNVTVYVEKGDHPAINVVEAFA